MDVTVHSNAGFVGAAASPATFAQGSTTMIPPASVTITPFVINLSSRIILPLLCLLLMMLPLHFLVVPLIKIPGLSSLGSLLPPLEPPARQVASIPSESNNQEQCFQHRSQKAD
jgi:hypothetical protein